MPPVVRARPRHFRATRLRERGCMPRPSRRISALLAALYLLAGLAIGGVDRALHFALVPHTWCEHGELVDGDRDEPGAVQAVATTSPRRADATAVGQGHDHSDGHEHCGWVAVQPAIVLVVQPALPSMLLEWQVLDVASAPTEQRSALPLLLLAPKSSPPLIG